MKVWLHTGKGVEAYVLLEDESEVTWASSKNTKKGDIILMYRGSPHSDIAYIFKAKENAYDDEYYSKRWKNASAVDLYKKISIPRTIKINEMRENPILGKWGVVRKNFMGSFFEVPPKEWSELKRLILEKNHELNEIKGLEDEGNLLNDNCNEIDFRDIGWGRAHVVRDICYLISKNENLTENKLFDLLRKRIKNKDNYWKAYYQRTTEQNGPLNNLHSARALNLVDKYDLKLTGLGKDLLSNIVDDELFTYKYSLKIRRFFYNLALQDYVIKKAMEILKEKKKLRFWAPTCDLTGKTMWKFHKENENYYCDKEKYSECKSCDRDLLVHIDESSLPFETYKETGVDGGGFVFWMCSRVTPMYITGNEPGYSGNYIYWDEEAEMELNYEIDPEKPYKLRIWKITPGNYDEINDFWPHYKEEGFIGIGWFGSEKDYLDFKSVEEIQKALFEFYRSSYKDINGPLQSARMIWDFTNSIKKGDLVVANGGYKKVLGIGIINSGYIGPKNLENPHIFDYFEHLRKVDWIIIDAIELKENTFNRNTVTELKETQWNKIKAEYIRKFPHYHKIFEELENEGIENESLPEDCPLVSMNPLKINTNLKIDPKIIDQVCGTLNSRKHILLTGAPGTGKTHLAEDICRIASAKNFSNGYILTTATSDWTTFDTIGGYMPDENAKLNFEDGKFLQAIRENKWLIIDEINRADIDKAFGQLFTVLSGQGVELPFKNNGKSVKIEPNHENRSYYDEETSTYKVGKNWRILSTMNVYDKDYLFEMSYAFMRRFTFIYIDLPEYEEFKELVNLWKNDLSQNSIELIEKLLEINKHRQIGPAIFKDIIEFANEMEKMESKNNIIADAVISYILPQLEGLDDLKIRKIWYIFKTAFEDNYEIKKRLEEISGIQLEKPQSE